MDLYSIFLNAHKGFGYLVLLLVIVFLLALLVDMFGFSGRISKFLKKSTLFTMILFHVQLIVGLVLLFFVSPGFKEALNTGTLMSNAYNRTTFVEHPFSMLLAAVLLTIVNKKLKTSKTLNFKIVLMAVVAVLLFANAFPWSRVFGS